MQKHTRTHSYSHMHMYCCHSCSCFPLANKRRRFSWFFFAFFIDVATFGQGVRRGGIAFVRCLLLSKMFFKSEIKNSYTCATPTPSLPATPLAHCQLFAFSIVVCELSHTIYDTFPYTCMAYLELPFVACFYFDLTTLVWGQFSLACERVR